MRDHDTVGEFNDELNVLLNSAHTALKEKKSNECQNRITPLNSVAVNIFIKGLPANLAERLDYSRPKDLIKAYEETVRLETRIRQK